MRDDIRQALAIDRSSTADERTIATGIVITDPGERRRVFVDIVAAFNERRGPPSPWPKAVLEDWVRHSPLAQVSFDAAD